MGAWSWGFRRGLRRALPEWEDEGLVSPEAAQVLRGRYGLDGDEAGDAANLAVYILGALLVFAGVASLVAFNWSGLPDAAKVGLAVGFMLGTEVLGFWMGFVDRRWPGLGHTLVVIGALSFVAALGLVLQILNREPGPLILGVWALASAGIALALRSTPTAAVASGAAFLWLMGEGVEGAQLGLPVAHAVWLGVLAWGFAYRSVGLGTLALVGGGITVAFFGRGDDLAARVLFAVPLAFCVAAHGVSPHLERASRASEGGAGTAAATSAVASGLAVLLAFAASFEAVAREFARDVQGEHPLRWVPILGPPLVVGVAGAVWTRGRAAWSSNGPHLASALALLASAFVGPAALLVVAHLALVGRVVLDLRRSLSELERGPFWSALVIGVGVIGARFLEIQTGLLAKAVAFLLAGLAVIAAGHRFETHRARGRR